MFIRKDGFRLEPDDRGKGLNLFVTSDEEDIHLGKVKREGNEYIAIRPLRENEGYKQERVRIISRESGLDAFTVVVNDLFRRYNSKRFL